MQGLLYHYLGGFVQSEFGAGFWDRIRARAGVPERSFVLARQYPDRYVYDLTAAVEEELGPAAQSRAELLFRYGRFLGRCFERDFSRYFQRFASTREMIAGIEPVIHAELRRHNPASQPPVLRSLPVPGGGLRVSYASHQQLCDVLRGLATEVADIYGERIAIEEPSCVKRSDPACEFLFTFFDGNESPRTSASPP